MIDFDKWNVCEETLEGVDVTLLSDVLLENEVPRKAINGLENPTPRASNGHVTSGFADMARPMFPLGSFLEANGGEEVLIDRSTTVLTDCEVRSSD